MKRSKFFMATAFVMAIGAAAISQANMVKLSSTYYKNEPLSNPTCQPKTCNVSGAQSCTGLYRESDCSGEQYVGSLRYNN